MRLGPLIHSLNSRPKNKQNFLKNLKYIFLNTNNQSLINLKHRSNSNIFNKMYPTAIERRKHMSLIRPNGSRVGVKWPAHKLFYHVENINREPLFSNANKAGLLYLANKSLKYRRLNAKYLLNVGKIDKLSTHINPIAKTYQAKHKIRYQGRNFGNRIITKLPNGYSVKFERGR